jgi:hypothetical protein
VKSFVPDADGQARPADVGEARERRLGGSAVLTLS